jgi:phage terminase small subunit
MGSRKNWECFAAEYLKDFNATQAAIRCGYSEKSAYSQGQRLLKNDEVKAYIASHQDAVMMDKDKIIRDNIEFLVDVRRNAEARTGDRLKATELLGKYAAMFTEKVEHSGLTIQLTQKPVDGEVKDLGTINRRNDD